MPDGGGAVAGLEADVNAMRGEVKLTPSVANNWQTGAQGAPRTDWKTMRVGAAPPEALARLRSDSSRDLLAACGVPSGLVGQSDGTTLREQLRQFLHIGVSPVAGQIADVIAEKFDLGAFQFDLSPLMASDLSGRARSLQSMVKAGMPLAEAMALSGLMVEDHDGHA